MRRSNNQGTDGLDREYAATFWKRTFFSHFSKLVARVQKGHFKSHGSYFTLYISKDFFIFQVWKNFEPIRVEGEMARKKTNKRWSLTLLQLVKYLSKAVKEGRFFSYKKNNTQSMGDWKTTSCAWNTFHQWWSHCVFGQKLTIDDCGWLKNNSSCMKYFRTMVIKVCFLAKKKISNNWWLRLIENMFALHGIF